MKALAQSGTKPGIKPGIKPGFDSRRNVVRREVRVACQAVREHDFVLIANRTLDVSTEGMLVPLERKVLTGESIIVSFEIPGMWIDVEAVVARIVHGRRPGDDGLAAGLVFDRLAPAARAALAGYLHALHEPTPRRRSLLALSSAIDTSDLGSEPDALGILRAVASAWAALGIDP